MRTNAAIFLQPIPNMDLIYFQFFLNHFTINSHAMSLLFVGFAASELCARIQHAEPKVIIAATCGIEPNRIVE